MNFVIFFIVFQTCHASCKVDYLYRTTGHPERSLTEGPHTVSEYSHITLYNFCCFLGHRIDRKKPQ